MGLKIFYIMLIVSSLAVYGKGEKRDVVWQQYRELELRGATMEQIMAGVDAWDATSYDIMLRVDTVDYDNGYINIDGVCDFEWYPKGYWSMGVVRGKVCHCLVTMTIRDEQLKVWFTRFSYGTTAEGLFHECNGLSYNSGPVCVEVPHTLKGIERFGAKQVYKRLKPHLQRWVDSTMQEIADYVAAAQATE